MDTVKVKIINELFKNGVVLEPGKTVELELQTAVNFQKAGDVKILDKLITETQEVEVYKKA